MKRRAFLTSLATAVAAVVVAPACVTPAPGVPVLEEPPATAEPVRRPRVLSPQDEEDMRWRASVLAASCVFFPVL